MSGRNEKYSGFGLPTLNFSQTNVIVAEFLTIKLTPQITCELKRGQVFKEATDQSVTFVFCGLARPKGNDMYLYFLADKEKASETSFSRFFTVAFRISEEWAVCQRQQNILRSTLPASATPKNLPFLSEAANPATKFIQTLLNRFYAQNPDEIPTKNTTKQRLSLFEVPVVPPPIPEKRKLPNETCVKEKRRKVVTKGKKAVPDEQLEEPSTPSTRNNPSSVDLNSTITRCIQTGLQALKSELRAELREEMKQESKAGLQLVHENSKQLHILTSKFQQEMADLLKSRDEKFSAQLKILTELKAPPVSEVKPDLCQRGTKAQKKNEI